ncbi:MAG: hypothetical protein H6577_12525 [Lewinellaceae bacterium]|nr:hypothetical protein [Saprospiraceae bacterium]MCB9338946.1 hypothetical protein [Lewinellaceae bacterium]
MKKMLTLVFCCMALCGQLLYGQCSGTVTLSNQALVNAFNCPTFSGNLTIQGNDIVNLDGLSELETVTGNFLIQNNPNLVSANLPNLVLVDNGALRITSNASLISPNWSGSARTMSAATTTSCIPSTSTTTTP